MQERVRIAIIVDVAAIVLKSVADDEIFDLHDYVVAADLVENFLCDIDVWCLVLDNHAWAEMLRI